MRLADGKQSPEDGRRLHDLIDADPALKQRYEAFLATTAERLQPVYRDVCQAPVPDWLEQAIRQHPGPTPAAPAPIAPAVERVVSLDEHRHRGAGGLAGSVEGHRTFGAGALAMAATLALVIGATGAWLAGVSGGGESLALGGIARGRTLQYALENSVSQDARAKVASGMVAPVLSFRSKQGGYCREYKSADRKFEYHGLACRNENGQWRVLGHVAVGLASGGARTGWSEPAGEMPALDQLVRQLRSNDDVPGPEEEKGLIGRGWK